jgi:hypothetical protein
VFGRPKNSGGSGTGHVPLCVDRGSMGVWG